MVCTICKAVLVTARRNRCTSCTSAAARLVAPLKAAAQKQSGSCCLSPGYSESSQFSPLTPSPVQCPMSPVQEASIAIGGIRSLRESVDPVLDMQVRHTGEKAAALPIFIHSIRVRPSTSIHGSSYSLLTPLSLPIVTRSSTTDLQAHPVTSLTHASLREVYQTIWHPQNLPVLHRYTSFSLTPRERPIS